MSPSSGSASDVSRRKSSRVVTSPIGFVCEFSSFSRSFYKNPRVCHSDFISELNEGMSFLPMVSLKYEWHTLERCLIWENRRPFFTHKTYGNGFSRAVKTTGSRHISHNANETHYPLVLKYHLKQSTLTRNLTSV